MVDNNVPRFDNIKGLVQDLVEKLDERMNALREGTILETVRPSDAKTFMLASRHPRTVADLAKAMDVSRQATHMSVQRLIAKGVIELQLAPGSRRDKIVVITEAGNEARQIAAKNIKSLETELVHKVGTNRLEEFRKTLIDLLDS